MELDAHTLAEWGADYVKLDGCNTPGGVDSYARGTILCNQITSLQTNLHFHSVFLSILCLPPFLV